MITTPSSAYGRERLGRAGEALPLAGGRGGALPEEPAWPSGAGIQRSGIGGRREREGFRRGRGGQDSGEPAGVWEEPSGNVSEVPTPAGSPRNVGRWKTFGPTLTGIRGD